MIKGFHAYFFLLFPSFLFAQNGTSFLWPIDSPRVISGNYGELRPAHFHAGLDFSTGGKVNMQVYAAEKGYVSRIKVSSVGYGKCVYITHPNGKVTVYAHLNSFSLKIAAIVRKEQYATKNFEVEILPKPRTIEIKRNEIIGLSGNTGGSSGPHLHFEIRDEKSETPLNPLGYFNIDDKLKPVLQKIAFYNLADTCSPKFLRSFKVIQDKSDSLRLENDRLVLDNAMLGLAFAGYDRCQVNGNPNNIYSARLYVDGRLVYAHSLNNIDFSESRYVNEFSETLERLKYQKCFLPTLYPPNIYSKCHNKGRLFLKDTVFHKIKLVLYDESGNENDLQFYLRTTAAPEYSAPSIKSDVYLECDEDLVITKNGLQIFIPSNTLYYSTPLIFENTIETSGKLIILPSEANLRASCVIGFKVPDKFLRNKSKLVLRSGNMTMTPVNTNDSVFYFIKNFGWFQMEVDTAGPKINTLLSHRKIKRLKHPDSISFTIRDPSSGIAKYSMTVNNKWVLSEYDAKSDLLTCYFDEETPAGKLNFNVEVEDKVGNKSAFKFSLKR